MSNGPLDQAPRRKKPVSKLGLIISVVFHAVLIVAVFFFAAKGGMLGKKMQKLTATLVPKEKKPEPPKEKPPEPKIEQARTEPKLALPQPVAASTPAPTGDLAPAAAPAANALPAFEFNDGAKDVQTLSDPTDLYKALVESALRSHWHRPDITGDENFTADVELTVDARGNILDSRWVRGSGNSRWDESVKAALVETTALSRPPPKDFPLAFTVRFDVDASEPDEGITLGSR